MKLAWHNSLRSPWSKTAAIVAGCFGMLWMMGRTEQMPHGALWGACVLIAVITVLISMLPYPDERSTSASNAITVPLYGSKTWIPWILSAITLAAGIAFARWLELDLDTTLPWLCLSATLWFAPCAWSRGEYFVGLTAALCLLPTLGSFGLVDPWETHYGEVAREILARDDWISTWWAQDGWFWSKPVLIFWTEAFAMNAFGFDPTPDVFPRYVEWIIRLPVLFLSMAALLFVHNTVRSVWNPRAAILSTLCLLSAPLFFFLARQAITDMFYVSLTTIGLCCVIRALSCAEHEPIGAVAFVSKRYSSLQLFVALFLIATLPQILYLYSRNVGFIDGGISFHSDMFRAGSAGNSGIPGNMFSFVLRSYWQGNVVAPASQATLWLLIVAWIVFRLRKPRAQHTYWMLGFYLCGALAVLGKGLPGIAIPAIVGFFFLLVTGRWELLRNGRFHVGLGLLVFLSVAAPWFVAMYVRHGDPFIERLFIHDHINRLAAGVHGDNGSVEYFLTQLGYGAFPMIAFAPFAVGLWLNLKPRLEPSKQNYSEVILGLWFACAFTLFNVMMTKFHHYIFPAVIPAAILVGLLLDRLLPQTAISIQDKILASIALPLAAALVVGFGAMMGNLRGIIPAKAVSTDWILDHPAPNLAVGGIVLSIALLWLIKRLSAHKMAQHGHRLPQVSAQIFATLFTAGILAALIGRDLSWDTGVSPKAYERLIHLFVYLYTRAWPEHLDYRAIVAGFGFASVLTIAVAAHPLYRRIGIYGFVGTGVLFCMWSSHVYMQDVGPHWSQQNLVQRYFAKRTSPKQPFVAWQMNWKGENFYTGNRVPVFTAGDNIEIKQWIQEHSGIHAFFIIQSDRYANFKKVLSPRQIIEHSTSRENNKFMLVSADL